MFGLKADVKVVETGDETVIDGIKSKKNKTITVRASYGDKDFQSEIKQDVFQIIDIKENALTLRLNDVDGKLVPSFTNRYFLSCLKKYKQYWGK